MAKKAKKRKVGAPTKMTRDLKKFIIYLYKEGKTDSQVAKSVEVCEATINNWKKKYPEFLESIKEAKLTPDEEVERSLFKNALGYDYREQKAMTVSQGKGLPSEIEIVTVTQHKAADTKAQIYWLQNRQPQKWRNLKSVEHSGKDGGVISIEHQVEEVLGLIDGKTAGLNQHEET